MAGRRKLLSFWVWMLLVATLCPGAQYAHGKRGGIFKGRSKGDGNKGDGNKAPPSQGGGLSKQGLKWAGAAAAGMLGGTGTGYGLGFLGKPKHVSGSHHYGHKTVSSGQDQHPQHGGSSNNQSLWRAFVKGAASGPLPNVFLTLGHPDLILSFFFFFFDVFEALSAANECFGLSNKI
uniref:Shadow of prion protein 2 n=1 Tax=Salarias fasciatus TaxID=181472 RepID=A0A672FAX0_SALFA